MEDKILKARCINRHSQFSLTNLKEYIVLESNEKEYRIKDDCNEEIWYNKSWFEEVKEDVLMVECIWSDGTLELNKEYKVLNENGIAYCITNDSNKNEWYSKDMFKPAPKEQKKYTLQEVFENIKNGETYIQNTTDKFSITKEREG